MIDILKTSTVRIILILLVVFVVGSYLYMKFKDLPKKTTNGTYFYKKS